MSSLINAAKAIASHSGLPWAKVQPFYRSLQSFNDEDISIPRSSGRKIIEAEPEHVARIILSVSISQSVSECGEAMRWASSLCFADNEYHPGRSSLKFISYFPGLVRSASLASDVHVIEFLPDCGSAIVHHRSGEPLFFKTSHMKGRDKGFISRSAIRGEMLKALAVELF